MTGIIEDDIVISEPIGEIIPPESKAAELFVPNGLDKILTLIRKEVENFQHDMSTEKGRKATASLARKVSSSMARLEDYGKNLSMNIKRQATGIDSERKRMKEILTALRDEARKPLTDYEEAIKVRIDAHEQALIEVGELSNVPFGATVAEIEARMATLDEFSLRNWEEFAARFGLANDAVSKRLNQILVETKAQAEQKAAFAKLEAERIARESKETKERQAAEQAERDARIAREATEKAERESAERESKAKRDAEAAEARAAKAEQDAKEAAERATAAEQKRAADAKAKEAAETAARENDKAHKAEIHSAAMVAIACIPGIDKEHAKAIVIAIARGDIPNVKVIY
jgi:hypothetical protein